MIKVGLLAILLFLFVGVSPDAVLAQGNKRENVCNRVEEAYRGRMKGYERAREVRKKAFERTLARWEKLFTKLDELGVNTGPVKADAAEVATSFEALLAADDALVEAKRNLAKAQCAEDGVAEARRAVEDAQKNRKEARKAYNTALKKLHTDLAKLRPIKKDTKTETEND